MTTNQNPYAMQDANFARAQREAEQQEAQEIAWDEACPEWREMSLDPEDRETVAYADVQDPEAGIVRGYGGDHRRYFPGAFGE